MHEQPSGPTVAEWPVPAGRSSRSPAVSSTSPSSVWNTIDPVRQNSTLSSWWSWRPCTDHRVRWPTSRAPSTPRPRTQPGESSRPAVPRGPRGPHRVLQSDASLVRQPDVAPAVDGRHPSAGERPPAGRARVPVRTGAPAAPRASGVDATLQHRAGRGLSTASSARGPSGSRAPRQVWCRPGSSMRRSPSSRVGIPRAPRAGCSRACRPAFSRFVEHAQRLDQPVARLRGSITSSTNPAPRRRTGSRTCPDTRGSARPVCAQGRRPRSCGTRR